jgi:hypothetical protein
MHRRTFLLGLVGGLASAAGLAATSSPADALPLSPAPLPKPGDKPEPAVLMPEDLDGLRIEEARGYRHHHHHHCRPHRPKRRCYKVCRPYRPKPRPRPRYY